jgi:glycosyltransferase involved in cell wall biosynthesis
MRVAIDVGPLMGQWGGIRRYTVELVRALSRIDSRNEYALSGAPNHWVEELALGSKFEGFPTKSRRHHLIDLIRLSSIPGRVDLFHATNYSAPLVPRFPTVVTVHDLTVVLFPKTHPLRRRLRHRLLPRFCHQAARVIADSHNTKRDLVRCYGIEPEKIDVIYLAVDDRMRRISDSTALQVVRERYRLPDIFNLFLGSVEPRKNLGVLLEATRTLKEARSEHRLVIAGRPEPDYLATVRRTIRRLGLIEGEDVILTGQVDDRDLPALYSLCTLFVYPSLYEGFGLPPLEAMACEAPVLVPNNSSLSELYQECGALFDLERPEDLVGVMRELLDNPQQRAELAEYGRKRAHARSWDDLAAETLDVYERAVASH